MATSRINDFGQDMTSAIYNRIKEIRIDPNLEEKEKLKYYKKVTSDGKVRLDQYAQEAYGDGLDWWIIAAASGIGWWLSIEQGTQLYIPKPFVIENLKRERF